MSLLRLRNPHSILAALEMRPQDVKQIFLPPRIREQETWGQVSSLAQKYGIPIAPFDPLVKQSREKEMGRGVVAEGLVLPKGSVSIESLFSEAKKFSTGGALWLALDCLQDPHNIGAIFRTAAFFGIKGILLTQERSAPLSETVYDVASGGIEFVPFTLQMNLQRAFEAAKAMGLWILGTSEHAKDSLFSMKSDRSWLVVFGNEETGIRRLTSDRCDVLCKIPAQGSLGSLNVSVSAGVFIAHFSQLQL